MKDKKYEPVDSEQLSSYREDKSGQVLEEGITSLVQCLLGLLLELHTQIMI